jgi:hypothetical protein
LIQELLIKKLINKAKSGKEYKNWSRRPNDKPYALILTKKNELEFFIEAIDNDNNLYLGEKSKQGEFSHSLDEKDKLTICEASKLDLEIVHFYNKGGIRFLGCFDFLVNKVTRFKYIRRWVDERKKEKDRIKFESTKMILKDRMEILEYLVERYCSNNSPMTLEEIMSSTVSARWVYHPDSTSLKKRLALMLESLVLTGDLKRVNNQYQALPKAVATIGDYRENGLKHRQLIVIQKGMLFLTVTLAFLAAIQSKIIELETIINLKGMPILSSLALLFFILLMWWVNKSHNKQFKSDS